VACHAEALFGEWVLEGARDLSARQRSLQYKTLSQFLAQLLRHTMARPQTAQGFCGKLCLFPLNPGVLAMLFSNGQRGDVTIRSNKFKLISHKMSFQVQMNHSSVKKWGFNLVLGALAAMLGLGLEAAQASPQTAVQAPACPAILNHSFDRLQDEKPQSLCQYAGKVVLVVNTASFCGFTSQYKGLETLNTQYKDRGLVVLGFPSNDFAQEKGSNKDIADFCESTFGVKFPMFIKTQVTGEGAAPLFKQLTAQTGQKPRWNFHKYLIGRDGKVIDQYSSMTGPESKTLLSAIDKALKAKP
jgi:glutathione peroxidase